MNLSGSDRFFLLRIPQRHYAEPGQEHERGSRYQEPQPAEVHGQPGSAGNREQKYSGGRAQYPAGADDIGKRR